MNLKRHAGATALLLALAIPAFAQQPPTPPPPPDAPRVPGIQRMRMLNVEAAMRHKELLRLSDSQLSQLEALRREIVAERQELARERIDIASRLAAGLIDREAVHKQRDARHEALRQKMEQRRDRIEKILTEEQRDVLQRTTRRHMMERMHGRGQHRGGMERGLRPGMTPRERFRF